MDQRWKLATKLTDKKINIQDLSVFQIVFSKVFELLFYNIKFRNFLLRKELEINFSSTLVKFPLVTCNKV